MRLKAEEYDQLAEGERLRVEEHERARLKLGEGVRLDHKSIRIAEEEEEHHTRLKAEEEAHIIEEARLKLEEEDLRLNSEDKACLFEDSRLKYEQEEQAHLKVE